jgi:hypothetical protein
VPREAIVPPCAENRHGFSPSLTPRKGHFSSSPWQRHGKTVPKKESALKGHPKMPGPSKRVASSWGAPAELNVLKRINPTALLWAASGLPLRGGDTPIIIESWYKSPAKERVTREKTRWPVAAARTLLPKAVPPRGAGAGYLPAGVWMMKLSIPSSPVSPSIRSTCSEFAQPCTRTVWACSGMVW